MSSQLMLLFLAGLCSASRASLTLEDLDGAFNEIFPNEVDLAVTHPDQKLTTVELISKYGYVGETHEIITEDNYILELHRIRASKSDTSKESKPVVLLVHGLLASSSVWVIPGPEKAFGYILANEGYDVWLGNVRGTKYSRRHVWLTTNDKEYWDFSFHEIGMKDLPAMIDHILKKTGQEKLFYMGHSQGTTIFYVMASQKPEYQEKVEAMFAMAPVAYCSRMASPIFQTLARITNNIYAVMKLIGKYEFQPTTECMKKLKSIICDEKAITQPICSNVLFLIGGYSYNQLNMTLLPILLSHVPAGASTKQFMHYAQLVRSGKFRQYDHGIIGNLKTYEKLVPPAYDLGSIKVPVFLHYSVNDWLAHVRDVHQTYNELGNVVAKFRIPHDTFNHLDFMWGIDAKTLLYDKIISLLSRFKK